MAIGTFVCVTGCKLETSYPEKIVLNLPEKNVASLELLRIKPGKFIMGTPEKNKSAIISNHFWIGKFEVTQEQWQSLMENNPSKYKAKNHRKCVISSCKLLREMVYCL